MKTVYLMQLCAKKYEKKCEVIVYLDQKKLAATHDNKFQKKLALLKLFYPPAEV